MTGTSDELARTTEDRRRDDEGGHLNGRSFPPDNPPKYPTRSVSDKVIEDFLDQRDHCPIGC